MGEDDSDQAQESRGGTMEGLMDSDPLNDLFGGYSVIGGGVHVMIDGRNVSSPET